LSSTSYLQDRLISYLEDVHSLEESALAQLRTGVGNVDHEGLREAFRQHLTETEEHERLIAERLESYGNTRSALKDLAQKGHAMASGLVAKVAPDTAGKLAIQAYAFEHWEIASYRMLIVAAQDADDQQTIQVARQILQQEEMAARTLDGLLESVAEYDLREVRAAS
jgi:ferritin-like metal-binding protein YciE